MPALLWMKAIDKRALSWGDVLEKPYEKYCGKVGRGVAKNGGLAVRVRFWYCQKPFPTAPKSVSDLLKNQRWTLQKRFLRGWSAVLITSKHLVVNAKNTTINISHYKSVIYKKCSEICENECNIVSGAENRLYEPSILSVLSTNWQLRLIRYPMPTLPFSTASLYVPAARGISRKNTIVIKRVKAGQSPPLLVSCFRHWDTQICKYQEAYLLISK